MTDTAYELEQRTSVTGPRDVLDFEVAALPQADGGHQALLVLAGSFMSNVCVWGFAFSFGVLQDYYTTHEPFSAAPGGIAAIGTTTTGLMYLLMPVYFLVLQRYKRWRRYSCWISLFFLAGALISASYAQSVSHLILTQGILFALGGNMIVVPTISYLDEWFIQRKGFAMGIMWAGDGTGAVIFPVVIEALLSRYGFRTTLQILACAIVLLIAPFVPFMKPRVPLARTSTARPFSMSFLRSKSFWILQCFNIIEATGYFLPPNYLPAFAQHLGYNAQLRSLTLVLNGLTSVVGCIFVGFLVDRLEITVIVFCISILAALTIFIIWGTSTSIGPLLIFSATYGLTAGAYSSTWTGMTKRLQSSDPSIDASIALSFLAAGRGIGSIISGPLSEGLLTGSSQLETASLAYGSGYGALIIFSGCTAMVGGLSFLAHRTGLL